VNEILTLENLRIQIEPHRDAYPLRFLARLIILHILYDLLKAEIAGLRVYTHSEALSGTMFGMYGGIRKVTSGKAG
jgi:hypothetical protein